MRLALPLLLALLLAVPALAQDRPSVHEGLLGDRAQNVRVNRGPEVTPEPSKPTPGPTITVTSRPRVVVETPQYRYVRRSYFPFRPAYRQSPKLRFALRYKDGDLGGRLSYGTLPRHLPHYRPIYPTLPPAKPDVVGNPPGR